VAERFKVLVLKTSVFSNTMGSNPILSGFILFYIILIKYKYTNININLNLYFIKIWVIQARNERYKSP
jgi:hypothetical protein